MSEKDMEANLDEDDPELATKRQKELEAEMQKQKARQAFLENVYVLIAMILIVALAVISVVLKAVIWPEEKIITFTPLQQQVKSTIKYTGNGFIPCDGYVPSPSACDFPPYYAKMHRNY
eukprot:TRINITY_DN37022_c0_g1_i1.p1 TRINITY_DN37022_c0_g1~~TRINITY_DN37022_c0_g1_i1.p1  ORF type:complete len:119 (+),score=48.46 TRINITY_DN37022_c0_g1_i1:20-376(+)